MLIMIRTERAIQIAFTFFLCLLSNNICNIILRYEGVAKKTKSQARYLLLAFSSGANPHHFFSSPGGLAGDGERRGK